MFGMNKGMQDMLANLAQRILGMKPEEIRQKVEETSALIKGTLAHFDNRLAAVEREMSRMNSNMERMGYGETNVKSAGIGECGRNLVPCPDFVGTAFGGSAAGDAGKTNGGIEGRQNADGLTP